MTNLGDCIKRQFEFENEIIVHFAFQVKMEITMYTRRIPVQFSLVHAM